LSFLWVGVGVRLAAGGQSTSSSWYQACLWCSWPDDFLWGTNWIYICHVEESRPPLWSRGQSSWLQNGDVFCFL
jgi:hypothetical protein